MKDKPQTQVPALAGDKRLAVAQRVDQIADGAMDLFKDAGSFEAELSVAVAVTDLRMALTDEMMQPVMGLMNTDLGFRTDRDPKLTPKDRDGNAMTPYPVEVVRECFIESKLRGFHSCGNEWNIIQGRFYACKNGLKRKCEQWPMVTDLKVDFGVPKTFDRGAIVPVKARWRKDGVADAIEADIPVRVNSGMGADAIIGKAERKIYKRIHDRLGGVVTPDGEAYEETEVQPGTRPEPRFETMKQAQATVATADASQAVPSAEKAPLVETPQARIAKAIEEMGHNFADLKEWITKTGWLPPEKIKNAQGFSDLDDVTCHRLLNAKGGLRDGLAKRFGGAE